MMRQFRNREEQQEISESERLIQAELQEVMRLVCVFRESAGDGDFLERLLDGRPCEPEYVRKLALFVLLHMEPATDQRPATARERILETCRKFLGDQEFLKLVARKSRRNIFDDFADEHIKRTGQPDEFLEGLRHAS